MPVEDHAWNVGRYTVHGELASGGMATVHIGRMGGAGGFTKLVAVKRMHPQFAKDPDFLAMFLDEARLVTRIRHPNVVQPLDVIVERGEVLLVMEYIHGEALSRISRVLRGKNERIPLRIAVAIMSGVLHGLHAAHEAKSEKGEPLGIVHRDVSPQNVIVGVDGVARVLDFGIAKAADQVHLTREGELKGKLVYMAPEQLLGEPVTRRTDIFSASVVLWECLAGQRLFESDSQSALLARARMQKVDAPSEYSHEVSPKLDEIVLKGLMLQQSARWETARQMALALEEAVSPATTAQVGGWVEQVAAKALAERQSRIHEIEAAGADSSASSRELVADITSDRIFTEDIMSAQSASGLRRQSQNPAPPAARSGSHPTPAPRLTPTPPAASGTLRSKDAATKRERADPERLSGPPQPPQPRLPSRPSFTGPSVRRDELYVPPAGPDPSGRLPLASQSLEAPAIPTEHAAPAKTHVTPIANRGRLGGILILVVLLLFVGGLLGSPTLVRRSIIDGFAARGIVATIEEVDLFSQIGTARIVGLALSSPEVPGATARVHEALADLNGSLEPTTIIVRDVDVNIAVAYAPLVKSLSAWSKKHGDGSTFGFPSSVKHARVESGHVVWNQPSGVGTRLEARSMTLDMMPKEGRKLGEDFGMEPTGVDVMTPLGALGPWLMDGSRTGAAYHLHLSFNQAQQQSFGLDVTGSADSTKVDLRVSRATPVDLGAKPDIVGAAPTDVVKVDAMAHLERKAAAWTGTVSTTVDGFHLLGARPAPLQADLSFAGVGGASLDVQRGRLNLGPADAPLTGTVTLLDDAVVARLASSVSVRCDDGPRNIPLALAIDSRDLGATAITPAARLCAPRK
jgi:serine/threonine protein kinase